MSESTSIKGDNDIKRLKYSKPGNVPWKCHINVFISNEKYVFITNGMVFLFRVIFDVQLKSVGSRVTAWHRFCLIQAASYPTKTV